MTRTASIIATIAAVAAIAAAYGAYQLGMQHGMQMAPPPTGSASPKQPTSDPTSWTVTQGQDATRRHERDGLKAGDVDPVTGRRILYYHDPMVPGKQFSAPGKSPFMDMLLVPMYAGAESADTAQVTISPRVAQNIGLRTAQVVEASMSPRLTAVPEILDGDCFWVGAATFAGLFFETQNTGSQAFIFVWPVLLLVLKRASRFDGGALILVLGLVALACVIYQVKYQARGLDAEIRTLNGQIDEERDAIAVLRAEWSLLNRPERIERLAQKHLKLAPAKPVQIVTLDKVTDRDFDPARLKQVLYNYLSNALKFSPAGERVDVRVRAEGAASFRIDVQDRGPGIAREEQHRLFVEFEQIDAGRAKQHAGTGLGLALTRRLVEAQGGTVGVVSERGAGAIGVVERIQRQHLVARIAEPEQRGGDRLGRPERHLDVLVLEPVAALLVRATRLAQTRLPDSVAALADGLATVEPA